MKIVKLIAWMWYTALLGATVYLCIMVSQENPPWTAGALYLLLAGALLSYYAGQLERRQLRKAEAEARVSLETARKRMAEIKNAFDSTYYGVPKENECDPNTD